MFPPKKKSALTSLAVSFGKGGGKDEAEIDAAPESSPDDLTGYGAAFESLASALNIPSDKQAAAKAALKQFVSACMSEESAEGE